MPSRLIPRLLVVFTRQLEILVTTLHFKTQGERSPWIALSYHSLPRHSGILKYMYLYRSTSLENYMS